MINTYTSPDITVNRGFLPDWMVGPVAKGLTVVGLAAGLAACSGEVENYRNPGTPLKVEKGTSVFDDEKAGGFSPCGKVAVATTVEPVKEFVKQGNTVQDGQAMKIGFAEGSLPLEAGETCGDTLWVFATQAVEAS